MQARTAHTERHNHVAGIVGTPALHTDRRFLSLHRNPSEWSLHVHVHVHGVPACCSSLDVGTLKQFNHKVQIHMVFSDQVLDLCGAFRWVLLTCGF